MKIDKKVPLPKRAGRKGGGRWQLLLKDMKIGDSVGGLTSKEYAYMRYAALSLDMLVVRREEQNGKYRVWRTA